MLPVRIHFGLGRLFKKWGPWVLGLTIALLLAMRWRGIAVPGFIQSGKTLAVLTWMALTASLLGLLLGLSQTMAFPR